MKSYLIGNKEYKYICNIHNELLDIFYRLSLLKNSKVDGIINNSTLLVEAALDMGRRMENKLRQTSYNIIDDQSIEIPYNSSNITNDGETLSDLFNYTKIMEDKKW